MTHCRIVVVNDLQTAMTIANQYAPEHLLLQIDDPRRALDGIQNAGSVFVGPWSPESVGDYCSGTNHVLPTFGMARSCSGLGVEHFLRQMTIQELSKTGLRSIADSVIELATLEGLDGHANAVRVRLDENIAMETRE
jgi:histidinol dehydrogenase